MEKINIGDVFRMQIIFTVEDMTVTEIDGEIITLEGGGITIYRTIDHLMNF